MLVEAELDVTLDEVGVGYVDHYGVVVELGVPGGRGWGRGGEGLEIDVKAR